MPATFPYSIDWLPDGRLLVVSGQEALLLRQEPDGALVTHADLPAWPRCGTRSSSTAGATPTSTARLRLGEPRHHRAGRPDGSVRQVADDIAFPNGMAVTPDNSTLIVAESYGNG